MSETAYWCLGSNIQPTIHIPNAIAQFKQDFGQVIVSKMYRSPAVGFEGKDFINAVLATQTDLPLAKLLAYSDKLESAAGRVRTARGRFDSRTLDLDLLMLGDLCGEHKGREWPSADIVEFAHVLIPLAEIAPDLVHPILGKTIDQLLAESEFNLPHQTHVQSD